MQLAHMGSASSDVTGSARGCPQCHVPGGSCLCCLCMADCTFCTDARPELRVGFVRGQGLFSAERVLLLRSNSILCNQHSLALDRN